MTFTEMYKDADLNQLNTLLAAEGKNYEFYREGEEINFRIKERETDGFSVIKSRRDRVQGINSK